MSACCCSGVWMPLHHHGKSSRLRDSTIVEALKRQRAACRSLAIHHLDCPNAWRLRTNQRKWPVCTPRNVSLPRACNSRLPGSPTSSSDGEWRPMGTVPSVRLFVMTFTLCYIFSFSELTLYPRISEQTPGCSSCFSSGSLPTSTF